MLANKFTLLLVAFGIGAIGEQFWRRLVRAEGSAEGVPTLSIVLQSEPSLRFSQLLKFLPTATPAEVGELARTLADDEMGSGDINAGVLWPSLLARWVEVDAESAWNFVYEHPDIDLGERYWDICTVVNPAGALAIARTQPDRDRYASKAYALLATSEVLTSFEDVAIPPGSPQQQQLSQAIGALAKRDPMAALEWLQDRDDRTNYLGTALAEFARSDSKRAFEWIEANVADDLQPGLNGVVFRTWAKDEPVEAWEELERRAENDRLLQSESRYLLPELGRVSPERAMSAFGAMDKTELADCDLIQGRLLIQWAETDVEAAADWIESNVPESERNRLFVEIALAAHRKGTPIEANPALSKPILNDPRLREALDLTPERLRDPRVPIDKVIDGTLPHVSDARGCFAAFARENPTNAQAYLDSLPEGMIKNAARRGMADFLTATDLGAAQEFIDAIDDDATRDEAIYEFALVTATTDPDAAISFAFGSKERQRTISDSLWMIAATDLESAINQLDKLPPGWREECAAQLVRELNSFNLRRFADPSGFKVNNLGGAAFYKHVTRWIFGQQDISSPEVGVWLDKFPRGKLRDGWSHLCGSLRAVESILHPTMVEARHRRIPSCSIAKRSKNGAVLRHRLSAGD